ncbi:MAG TPA: protein-L-isoaspartate O-methyltransferase [Rubrivivax sp.]|nr:protein-L-isoaspartate O-methyltransferase [Pseudomonadota bacterium]MCW5639285.1 protein-L-isoaspartate O-methyltransferase [Rubrivivax sp.]HOW48002.1 protein-L-isoaspartate O-methyltransferase [Rubrivivax sp.]HRY87553.1 protein-L-isoaspartate O-methyltransferase [Rubrivivax sp.]HRZ60781.1 protein-L-isoaspartate O-methyltransferase [Rubrivivax sp.]
MNVEQMRFNMIEQQIRPWDVLDPQVLALLAQVRREDFVPEACRTLAFVDMELPLPEGQCMLAPKVEARMLQELQLRPSDSVLEIGAGSGYMAALLAHKALRVISLEIRPVLARLAAANLERAAVGTAGVRCADGAAGLPTEAPFDAIVLSGSVADVPRHLLEQLTIGGRLMAIVGTGPVMRARLYTRAGEAEWSQADLFDTVAPRLDGFAEHPRFVF